jgi:diguanylate cyclase (GGDEF)-like protein
MASDDDAIGIAQMPPQSCRPGTPRAVFRNLSLGRKVALIPGLTLLLMGLMLAVGVQTGEQNTAALSALDRDVFEPLNRAQTMKDGITQLHTELFALLSLGTNQSDPAAQKAGAGTLIAQLDDEVTTFGRLLDATGAVPPAIAVRLREEFSTYAAGVRETASFAAYDASYGALVAGATDGHFVTLRADLADLVRTLAQRRVSLTKEVVASAVNAQHQLLGLGLGAVVLALLGSSLVGRSISRPVLRLTSLMNGLAGGNTDLAVPGAERRDEVGAMARAVEVFRANAIARRQGEIALRHTNLLFDTALNSMLQGMLVWSPEHRVQLVNDRFFAMYGLPPGCIGPGATVREMVDAVVRLGLYLDKDPEMICADIIGRLTARRSTQIEMEVRTGRLVRIAYEPMANGGTVVTFDDVTEKRRNEQQIAFMAHHDALTGLPNRVLFQDHMETTVAGLGEGQQFAVLCLDLDHFKEVNDTLGHAAGDELLRLVAGRLRHCVRDRDLVARLGGDEFAIVLDGLAGDPVPVAALATRLLESIGSPYVLQGRNIVIGTSIGIALSDPGMPGAEFLKRADVALYRAKEERGSFAFYEPGMDEHLQARHELEADLRLAVQHCEFELHYQPLYNLAEDRVTGFEALVRWNSPTRGQVSPADFIPLAEQTGLIVPIGEWVLRTACSEAAAWPDHVGVAVNLSPVQVKNKRLMTMVRETLQETGLPAARLELEITETVLLQDTEAVMTLLHSLHDLGVRISMDDFGTGYSSLSYLLRFPFDKIKIDRSFISELREAPGETESATAASAMKLASARNAAIIVHTMIGLGTSLGIATIAEGVETAEQFVQIRQKGCTAVQGYFLSRPRPANEIEALRQRLDMTMPLIAGGRRAAPQLVA